MVGRRSIQESIKPAYQESFHELSRDTQEYVALGWDGFMLDPVAALAIALRDYSDPRVQDAFVGFSDGWNMEYEGTDTPLVGGTGRWYDLGVGTGRSAVRASHRRDAAFALSWPARARKFLRKTFAGEVSVVDPVGGMLRLSD